MFISTGIRARFYFLETFTNICLLFCFNTLLLHIHCFKINTPGVLLAYNDGGIPSNFTLKIAGYKENECFQYHSSNERVINITPLFENDANCSRKAILSSVANLLEREITEIFVTSNKGPETVYCHVITDVISSVELQYISSQLILGGPPQKISVIAKDKQGHTFDSINGLEVDWKIVHKLETSLEASEGKDEDEVIRVETLENSYYDESLDNDIIKRGFNSSSILVEALRLGQVFISASLQRSSKSVGIHSKEINLRAVPNLMIYPQSPVYMLRHTTANLRLKKYRNEEAVLADVVSVDIANVDGSDVVELAEDLSHLEAKEYGVASVVFNNKNSVETATLDIHVVKLARMGITVSSGNNTILEQMKVYEVTLHLFDEFENTIYPSDNMLFSVIFPSKLFHVIYTTDNGTYSVVKAISPGKGKIKAEYKGIVLKDDSISKEKGISNYLNITICQKINIFPPGLLLPILLGNAKHDIPLKVTGGTGNYLYALSDNTAAKIIKKGPNVWLEIEKSTEVLDLKVTVTDKNNLNFVATAAVSIQVPLDLEVFPTVTETEVGNVLILPTALLGYEDKAKNIIRKFDDCAKSNITVDIIEKFVLSLDEDPAIPSFGKGCISLQFKCKMAGFSRVNLKYTNGPITYNTTTMLSCYKALKPVYPVRVGITSLGTSMELAFEGGPRRWPLYKDGYIQQLESSNPDLVKIFLIKDPVRYNKDLTVFRVICMALGETTLTLQIENSPSATLRHPAKAETSIKFICGEPYSLHLKLQKTKSKRELKDENIVKVPFYGDKSFSVDVYIKDNMGRKFGNMSCFKLLWEVSDRTLANPISDLDFVTHDNAVAGYRKISRNFKEFKMSGVAGELIVTAKLTSYKKEVLAKEGIEKYIEIEEISKSLDLKLVSLRDINAGLYDATNEANEEDGYCEGDSCKS